MQLANLDDIADLKVDHTLGSLVDARTGKKVGLHPFRIVYARHSKKMFRQGLQGTWSLACSSSDAVTGTPASGESRPCGSSPKDCGACKPELTLGLITSQGRMVVLTVSASIAKEFNLRLHKTSQRPVPIFDPFWSISIMATQKSSQMSYAQVALRENPSLRDAPSYEECLKARERLATMIDAKVDRTPGRARPSLAGGALKM